MKKKLASCDRKSNYHRISSNITCQASKARLIAKVQSMHSHLEDLLYILSVKKEVAATVYCECNKYFKLMPCSYS